MEEQLSLKAMLRQAERLAVTPHRCSKTAYRVCVMMVVQYLLTHIPWINGRHFTGDIFRGISVNEKFCILIKILPKFVPKSPIDNNRAFV